MVWTDGVCVRRPEGGVCSMSAGGCSDARTRLALRPQELFLNWYALHEMDPLGMSDGPGCCEYSHDIAPR
jgi:hypothetical protein